MRYVVISALAFALAVVSASAQTKAAAAKSGKQPPACASIAFRPVPQGSPDGEEEAGLYKSRFGRINVMASVRSGLAENYYVTVNGQKLASAGNLPASVNGCAQKKKLPAPTMAPATNACTGDRLQVLIDHTGDKRYVLLYARAANKWTLCSTGVAA
jgi:hypothetical protein